MSCPECSELEELRKKHEQLKQRFDKYMEEEEHDHDVLVENSQDIVLLKRALKRFLKKRSILGWLLFGGVSKKDLDDSQNL